MRFSPALVAVTAAALALPSSAAANSVSPTPKTVAAANAGVSSCGSLSGMTMTWTVVDGTVTAISLASIPSGCNGATLSITLVNASNGLLGSATATINNTSQTLTTITGAPDATTVATSYVSAVGP